MAKPRSSSPTHSTPATCSAWTIVPPSAAARSEHQLGVHAGQPVPARRPQLAPGKLRELERLLTGGDLMFADEYHNLVVNQGLDDLLAVTLS